MARYSYDARTLTGTPQKGTIEAKDEADARIKLRSKQLIPIKFKVLQDINSNQTKSNAVSFFSPKVKSKELQIFTRQFATLINSGIPILDALKILSQGATEKLIKEAAHKSSVITLAPRQVQKLKISQQHCLVQIKQNLGHL